MKFKDYHDRVEQAQIYIKKMLVSSKMTAADLELSVFELYQLGRGFTSKYVGMLKDSGFFEKPRPEPATVNPVEEADDILQREVNQ